jgi:hypothetical protein
MSYAGLEVAWRIAARISRVRVVILTGFATCARKPDGEGRALADPFAPG